MRSARVDYITGRFMIVHKNGGPNAEPDSAYAAGNEEETNPSILSLVVKDGMLRRRQDTDDKIVKGWSIRVFEDKNPIVTMAEDNEYGKEPLANQPIYGHHLVVVASPDTGKELSTIDVEQWSNVLVVVQDRLRWLNMQKGVAYVAIYADHDKALHGTVKMHPHLNIVSFKTVPPTIKDEMRSYQKSQEKMGICPTCYFIGSDGKDRIILKTESFVSYCPWSPSYPLEFSITPRRHSTSFAKITQKEIEDLALMMRAMLGGLVEITQDVP